MFSLALSLVVGQSLAASPALARLPAPSPIAAKVNVAFVVADVLQVRDQPRSDVQPKFRIRINTAISIVERKKGWVQFELLDDDDVGGYVPEQYIGAKPVRLRTADRRANRALAKGHTREAIRWSERALAIDGTNAKRWTRLRTALLRAKRTSDAAELDARGQGVGPVFLARCESRRLRLLAHLDRTGELNQVEVGGGNLDEETWNLLDGAAWFGIDARTNTVETARGTPFVRPRARRTKRLREDLGRNGSCDLESGLYSTSPIAFAPRAPFQWKQAPTVARTAPTKDVVAMEAHRRISIVDARLTTWRFRHGLRERHRTWSVVRAADAARIVGPFTLPSEPRRDQVVWGLIGPHLVGVAAGDGDGAPALSLVLVTDERAQTLSFARLHV